MLLLCASPCFGQRATFFGQNATAASAPITGWRYGQNTLPIDNFASKCSLGSSCTFTVLPTTANSAVMVDVITGNNVTISSVTGGSGSWSSTGCHVTNTGHNNMDAYYGTGITAGTTSFTVNLSGSATSFFYVGFHEALVPAGYTASFDKCVNFAVDNTTCSGTCNGVSFSGGNALTQTDAVFVAVDSGGTAVTNSLSSPYQMDQVGDFYALNVPAGTSTLSSGGLSAGASGYWTQIGVAFKSTANQFTAISPVFSLANSGAQLIVGGNMQFKSVSCSPTCDLTLAHSTTSGNYGVLYEMNQSSSSPTISAVAWTGTNGGTFSVQSGGSTCAISSGTSQIGCAVVPLTAAGTVIHVTMSTNGTYNFAWAEFNRNDAGSFSINYQNSASNGSSTTPAGITPTLGGANSACFQVILAGQRFNYLGDSYYYPQPGGDATFGTGILSQMAVLLNTNTDAAPTYLLNSASTTLVSAVCVK